MAIVATVRRTLLRMLVYPLIYLFKHMVRVDNKTILFSSFNGKAYSDSPKAVFEMLKNDDSFSDFTFIWALNNPEPIEGAEVVKFNSIKYFYLLAKAKYWLFNAKMPTYYKKKDDQIYVQFWHGTPLKKLGHDIVDNGQTYYRSKQTYQQMTRSYDQDSIKWDYLISPNSFSSSVFASAFKVSTSKMIESGYPRTDCLVNFGVSDKQQIKEKLGLPLDKKVILYAPTWRDDVFNVKGYGFDFELDFDYWHDQLGDEYVMLLKPHYLISNNYHIPTHLEDFVFMMDAKEDINTAYLSSDILITDYSSVFFDFALLNKPIYFYMYDFDKYKDILRGFYLNVPDDLPNEVIQDEHYLVDCIQKDKFDFNKLVDFNKRFNTWHDGKSTEKVIQEIFHEN